MYLIWYVSNSGVSSPAFRQLPPLAPTLSRPPSWGPFRGGGRRGSPDPQGISRILSTLPPTRPAALPAGPAASGAWSGPWGCEDRIPEWPGPRSRGSWSAWPGREDRAPGAAAAAAVMTHSQKALRLERKSPQEKAEEGTTSPRGVNPISTPGRLPSSDSLTVPPKTATSRRTVSFPVTNHSHHLPSDSRPKWGIATFKRMEMDTFHLFIRL